MGQCCARPAQEANEREKASGAGAHRWRGGRLRSLQMGLPPVPRHRRRHLLPRGPPSGLIVPTPFFT